MLHELGSVKETPLPTYDMPPHQWQRDSENPAPPILSSPGALPVTSRPNYPQNPVIQQGSTTDAPAWDAMDSSTSSLYSPSRPGQAQTLSTASFDYPELTDLAAGGSPVDFFRDMQTSMEMPFAGIGNDYPAIDAQSSYMSTTPSFEGADTNTFDVWLNTPVGFEYVRFLWLTRCFGVVSHFFRLFLASRNGEPTSPT